jgi:predicted AlkP superfamily phosphohydrolase/phosphomutase
MMPISSPNAYAGELAERYGLYKTVGWTYDTKALEQDDMTDAMFLDDVARTMAWMEQLTLDEIDRGNFDLLIAAWTATDRVSHMFWAERDPGHPAHDPERAARFGTVVDDTYSKADAIVGEVMARLAPDDLLMVLSDHGFHSFRYGFSVNTWLARNGYLAAKGQTDPATAYTDEKYLQGIDWQRTRAYGLGLGMIFLNLQGRERFGVVTKAQAPALLEELKSRLLATQDDARSAPIFRNIYSHFDAKGVAAADAPDLQLGYAEGYQTEKASAAGAVPKEVLTPNHDHWSGEHAASDVAFTPGIFFANQKLAESPRIQDLGVTALEVLGVAVPQEFEGTSLLLSDSQP